MHRVRDEFGSNARAQRYNMDSLDLEGGACAQGQRVALLCNRVSLPRLYPESAICLSLDATNLKYKGFNYNSNPTALFI